MAALTTLSWILLGIASLTALYWAVVLVRVIRINATRPTVRRGLGRDEPAGGWPDVSVVIPAHNEERVIDRCVRSMLAQDYPDFEVIVVLDRCTDGTLEILQKLADSDDRLTLLVNESCPNDWAGKCNAARLGSQHARGEMLLFIDADTHAHPELLNAAVSVSRERGLGLLSLLSTLTCEHRFEWTAQPVASMTLMTLYPPDLVNRLPKGRPFANGQFMLFKRECYDAIGGHDAVKDDLLEDIAFARCVDKSGEHVHILNADGLFTCSMYSSLESFRTGWLRIFIEACKRKPTRMRKMSRRVLLTGTIMPLAMLPCLVIGILVASTSETGPGLGLAITASAGLLLQGAALACVHRMGRQPVAAICGHPVGSIEVSRILKRAADVIDEGQPVVWAGKSYVLEAR